MDVPPVARAAPEVGVFAGGDGMVAAGRGPGPGPHPAEDGLPTPLRWSPRGGDGRNDAPMTPTGGRKCEDDTP
ncbi:hypothetical protein C1701_22495 [Actinoalloteichus sp. AHMU CJ021]|nr:hypothetical protein C1701_22495 [Actinoalloteichus sp. AHMU CJ021]